MKTVLMRILSLTITVSLVLPAAARQPATSKPPPPRYTPVDGVVRVVGAWEGLDSSRAAPEPPRKSQGTGASDTCLLSKSAGSAFVAPGDSLSYSVLVTNTTSLTETFRLTDTIPNHMTYITGTASGGFNYVAASHSLTASVTLGPSLADLVPTSIGPTYVELSGTATNICQTYPDIFPTCHNSVLRISGVPFQYLGVDYNSLTLDSNGFISPGLSNPGPSQNINQNLPDPAAPNNVIAGFWADLDLKGNAPGDSGGGAWYYALLRDSGSHVYYLVIEWKDAQRTGDNSTAYTFQIWIRVGTDQITLIYANLQGTASPATVGFENACGTFGHTQYFNGAGTLPAAGSRLSLVSTISTAQLSYAAQLDQSMPGGSLVTNTVSLSNGSGTIFDSALASTNVFGPASYFPLIAR